MFDFSRYHDEAVAIYGASPTGLSAYSALYKAGAHVFIWDQSKKIRARLKQAQIRCIDPQEWPWEELAVLVPDTAPQSGLALNHVIIRKAIASKIPIHTDIDLFATSMEQKSDAARPQVIGIAGTHGKSVAGSMITHILKEAGREVFHGGDNGVPVLTLGEGRADSTYVLELSTRTLAFTRQLRCDAGILLNLTGADVRFFGSPEKSIKSASRVFRNQTMNDALIVGADDTICQKICTALSSSTMHEAYGSENIIPVSGEATLGQGIFSLDGHIYDARFGKSVQVGDLTKPLSCVGPHFNQNIAAVYAACLHIGATASQITKGLQSWSGLSGCMNYLGEVDHTVLVDDSAATTVRSTLGALKGPPTIFWVGGGRKGKVNYARFKEAGETVIKAFLYGDAAELIRAATASAFDTEIFACPEKAMGQAITEASAYAASSSNQAVTILLSPGCPGTSSSSLSAMMNRQLRKRMEGTAA